MAGSLSPKRIYRFGLFEADSESGKLLREGMRVKLQDQPFRLLCLLLDRAGQIVTREELRQSLWSDNTYVEFDGSLNAALKRLRFALGDAADNPIFIETLPKRGYRFLAPVAAEEFTSLTPATQPLDDHSAREIDPAAEAIPVTSEPVSHRRGLGFGLALILLLLLGIASYHRLTEAGEKLESRAPQQQPVTPRVSVAVIGFNNASGRAEDAWLSTAFSEMLATELATGDKLRLVPGEDVAHLRLLSPWMQTGTLGQETSSRIGLGLSSDVLVLGSYVSVVRQGKKQLRVDARLQDAATGNVLLEVAESDNEENLFHLASVVGSRLRQKLGLPANTASEQAAELASLPSSAEAARFYALGLEKLREFDVQSARDLLEQAVAADPHFPLSHSMLARAWHGLGYEQKRKEEAKKALDLSSNLTRVDRLLVEGDYYESLPNHEKAASIYRALFALYPDSVEYGLQLALTQTASGHQDQALETIAELRRIPPPESADPRLDLAESRAISNSKPASLALVQRALSKAASQGKKLIYAQARNEECMNQIYGEHPDQGIASCEDAYKIFLAAGNRLGAADCLRLIGDGEGNGGHSEQAIENYDRALSILRNLGEHAKTGAVLNNLAGIYANQGKLDRAETLYRQAKDHFEQSGDPYNTGTAVGNIADILYLRGNLPVAIKFYLQAIEIETPLGPSNTSYARYRLADLQAAQGHVQEAQKNVQGAIDSLRPIKGAYRSLTEALIVLGETLELEGDSKGARQKFQEALDIQNKMGEMDLAAESQVELAQLADEDGHPEQADGPLRQAIAQFEKEKADPNTTSAYTVLSRTLQLENKMPEAREAIQHAVKLARNSSDPALTLPVAIQDARLEISSIAPGKSAAVFASARAKLRSTIAAAKRLGYYRIECEARLALGELELKANPETGQSLIRNLSDDARAHGLQLISQKASTLLAETNQVAHSQLP